MKIKRTPFTAAEVALLQQVFPTSATRAELQAAFPTRTLAGLRCKANKLGLLRAACPLVYWTPEDDELLRKHYAAQGSLELARRLKRTPQAVKARAARLGIKCELIGAQGHAANLESTTEHDPRPKAKNTLKPMQVRVKAAALPPTKRSPATPNLNARIDARLRESQSKKSESILDQVRALPANSKGREVYMLAARNGGQAATQAFREWQSQQARP